MESRTMGAESPIKIVDLTRYFESGKLGELVLPNGQAAYVCGSNLAMQEILDDRSFFVNLNDLYKLVVGWKVGENTVRSEDIVAVIVFGSSVHHPGFREEVVTRRKYWLFGSKVKITKKTPLQPKDIDILLVTSQNLTREESYPHVSRETGYGTVTMKGGIHLVTRGVDQLLKGVHVGDIVSIDALREGVAICANGRFEDVVAQAAMNRTTPRSIYWDQDNTGRLNGRIV